ncbi:hypothetical protein ACWCOP_02085 [Maricaulaceae bacterium MS644]
MSSSSLAAPSRANLWTGRGFTLVVFGLAGAGFVLTLRADAGGEADLTAAGWAFALASLVYGLGATALFIRGDYILRMFGCAWPLLLAPADEFQKVQRQRAFSFTFIVFLSAFSLFIGAHAGAMISQAFGAETVTGLLPTDAWGILAFLALVFFTLTLLPQAYLAWTLTPLDPLEDDAHSPEHGPERTA